MIPSFSDEALYTMLCKYLLNEADAEERAWVDGWLTEHEDNQQLLDALKKVLDTASSQQYAIKADTDSSWNQLFSQLDVAETYASPAPKKPQLRTISGSMFWKAAAVILVLVAVGTWIFLKRPSERFSGPVQTTLADGSTIQLKGDASQLDVARGFNSNNRKVILRGAATFDVAANPKQPFVVTLGNTDVLVLGTKFTINYEPEKSILQVHVSSGKVMVIDHNRIDSAILTSGMLLKQKAGNDFRITASVIDPDQKSLKFDNVTLEEALKTVGELYDIQIIVDDTSLLKMPIKATFINESIKNILDAMTISVGAKLEQTGDRQFHMKK
ncbi:FecR family protein [Chitinophaga sp. Hz27]|uniref:FecR family protein n=1 Tax=Chitinophaga sp. Hz27 TaxID=3347169 RepID=UPI0035D80534